MNISKPWQGDIPWGYEKRSKKRCGRTQIERERRGARDATAPGAISEPGAETSGKKVYGSINKPGVFVSLRRASQLALFLLNCNKFIVHFVAEPEIHILEIFSILRYKRLC
jgi:hypothetical protein